MLSMTVAGLPENPSKDIDAVFALISLISDVDAVKQRLEEFAAASKDAEAKIAQVATANAELDQRRAAQEVALKQERADHDSKLAEERAAADQAFAQRASAIDERDRQTAATAAQAKADADAAAKLKQDLQSRIDKIKAAAA